MIKKEFEFYTVKEKVPPQCRKLLIIKDKDYQFATFSVYKDEMCWISFISNWKWVEDEDLWAEIL